MPPEHHEYRLGNAPLRCGDVDKGAPDEADIVRLVMVFYARARTDTLIGPVFEAAVQDWPAHLSRLADFWSSVMLTSGRYKGNPFGIHQQLSLTPTMFDRWLVLWRETALEVFEPQIAAAFIIKAERIAESLTAGLFFKTEKGGT